MRQTSIDIGRILKLSGLDGTARAPRDEPSRRSRPVTEPAPASRALREQEQTGETGATPEGQGIRFTVPGFAPMTRIMTSFGAVYAQALRVGDMLRTRSGEYERIQWIDRVSLDEDFMSRNPDAQPVLIRQGAFGRDLPSQDVLLAPSQIVSPNEVGLIRNPIRARDLTGKPRILRKSEPAITYTRFHVGKDADVMCEKLWISINPEREAE